MFCWGQIELLIKTGCFCPSNIQYAVCMQFTNTSIQTVTLKNGPNFSIIFLSYFIFWQLCKLIPKSQSLNRCRRPNLCRIWMIRGRNCGVNMCSDVDCSFSAVSEWVFKYVCLFLSFSKLLNSLWPLQSTQEITLNGKKNWRTCCHGENNIYFCAFVALFWQFENFKLEHRSVVYIFRDVS